MRLGGIDHAPGDDQLLGAPKTDDARQALGAAVCEADVPAPACDAEGGVLIGDSNARPARPLKATGVGHAVHSRNCGLEDVGPVGLKMSVQRDGPRMPGRSPRA